MPTAAAASLRNGRMIEAETETAEIPIKKTAQVVLPMGSTSAANTQGAGVGCRAAYKRRRVMRILKMILLGAALALPAWEATQKQENAPAF
jgi:hypothetical protein